MNPTLLDLAKLYDPKGKPAVIANLLSQTNAILQDCTYVEGNLPTGHRVTIATGLPTVYYRAYNQGIPTSKKTTTTVDEPCALLEARSEVDRQLAKLYGNQEAFRFSEAQMFIEAMNQEMASGLFYGNHATDPKEFNGLAPRYSDSSAGNSQNIIRPDAGGSNINTSIWLVVWGENTVFCTYPKGTTIGLEQRNLGEYTAQNVNGVAGNMMQVLGEQYIWNTGLVVKDWRYAVRICNLQVGGATNSVNELKGIYNPIQASGASPTDFKDLVHLMVIAMHRIPSLQMGRPVYYCNRTIYSALVRAALEKSSQALGIVPAMNQFGNPTQELQFLGIPVRQCDAILNTEAAVA